MCAKPDFRHKLCNFRGIQRMICGALMRVNMLLKINICIYMQIGAFKNIRNTRKPIIETSGL